MSTDEIKEKLLHLIPLYQVVFDECRNITYLIQEENARFSSEQPCYNGFDEEHRIAWHKNRVIDLTAKLEAEKLRYSTLEVAIQGYTAILNHDKKEA